MKDVEIIGMLKSYIAKTLVGMGALKGAPCTVKSVEEDPGVHVITLEWTDNDGNKQTKDITVLDGTNGTDGFSPEVTVKTSTDSTYILTITTEDGSYETPNLKGGGSGGSSSMADLEDVELVSLSAGQILKWDAVNEKWVNASLGTAAAKDATNAVTEGSSDLLESGAAFTALADKADKSNTYTKTQTDNAITAEIEKLDVSDSATAGSYVTAVSEADGKISVTREAADAAPTSGSNKLVKSGGVFDANQSIYEVMGQNGAKNLLPFNLEKIKESNTSGTWAGNVYSIDGLTATFNSDGSISLNGTPSEWIAIKLVTPSFFDVLPANAYTLTGCPSGGSSLTYCLMAQFKDGTTNKSLNDYGSGATDTYGTNVSLTGGNVFVSLYPNIDFTGFTFKPMLRFASDTDDTYQPYAKTNQQLTAEQGYITDDQWTAINALYT